MIDVLLIVVVAIVLTWVWVRRNPDQARRTYTTLERSRKVGGAVVVLLVAFTFLLSGVLLLQLVAVLFIVLGALYFFVERPDKEVL